MSTLQHKIDFAVVLRVTNANPNGAPSLFSLHSAWNQSMSAARRSPKALAAKGTEASVVPTQWA